MGRALIIAYNDLNNSGVPNVIYQTVKALHNDYSFDVLVFDDDDYYYRKLCDEGIDIGLIKYLDQKPKLKISRLLWRYYKRPHNHYLFMKQLLRNNNYSVIHSFKEYYSWPFFKAAREACIRKRLYHRNVNYSQSKKIFNRLLEKHSMKLSIKYSTHLIGVSEACCKSAFKNNKYTVVYNSYDEYKYSMNIDNALSNNELVITHVASYSKNKNQLFSLEVLKELLKLHKETKLNLVGANVKDSYYARLIKFISDNKLNDNVSLIARNNNIEKIYEKTTFCILPSFSEGLSLTTIEAQACGISVFASTNITREVNCGGVMSLDLLSGPAYWAEEIYKLFKEIGNERTRYDISKFSFDKFKKQLEDLYH